MRKEDKIHKILEALYKLYPEPKTALAFATPFELLIATIMSAQTTDKVVNLLTPELFQKYPTPEKMAAAPVEEIAKLIAKVNFAGNKAKNIKATSVILTEKYKEKVPDTMVDLIALPGVARKTANVVLGNAYHKAEGIVVDTHVMRLTTRLGLTDKKDAEKIEQDLMQIIPKDKWIDFPLLLILYGREYAPAQPNRHKPGPLDELFLY